MAEALQNFAARWRVPAGFALGIAYLVLAQPTVPLLTAGALLAFFGLAIRAYAAGHLEKNENLATSGPYAYTRNPLYLGSLLIGIGLVVAGGRVILAIAFALFFGFVYGPVMRREEAHLRSHFGESYEHYAAAVPLFMPFRKPLDTSEERFRWQRYRRNREYEAALGYAAGIIFLVCKILLR